MRDHGLADLVVIGGGINGAGIARDAAGRGLRVILCEKGDLAEGTSSRSGKLIHGGLRYLEYYEFRLVREALIEREVLLRAAPHIVWPMRFVIAHSPEQRPAWMVRLGLFLYDHLGGRETLPGCRRLDLRSSPEGQPLKDEFRHAFEYSDCWVDDARLTVLNARDAADRGATVLTRTPAVSARREEGLWRVSFGGAEPGVARAKALVNAAGPWVEEVLGRVAGQNTGPRVRLVKGSHIVVPKFWEGPHAYLLQNHDKRVIFVNPYQERLGLIGTTDIPYEGRAEDVAIDAAEEAYLLQVVNRYMRRQLTSADIVHRYSGVRPLYDDKVANPSAVTRDYVFNVEGSPPLLSIFGGKITTYRKLAEHALEKLASALPGMGRPWTVGATLPGGAMPRGDFEGFVQALSRARPWLPAPLARHYARLYGTRAEELLEGVSDLGGLGRHHGGLFYAREAEFLISREWARGAADLLDRRTKHGLALSAKERAAVEAVYG